MNAITELALQHRKKTALQLRLEGMTYTDIAESMSMSVSTVHGYVKDSISAITKEDAEALRDVEVARLDALQHAVWDRALDGELKAVDTALKIIDRRIRLLGLDMPQQVAMGPNDVDLDATVEKLRTEFLRIEQAAWENNILDG